MAEYTSGTRKNTPAIPPNDYRGTQHDWMIGLQQRGWWDGKGWHGDVMLTEKQWAALLEECEPS